MDSHRLSKELKAFKKSIRNGVLPGVTDLSLIDDSLTVWQFHINADAFDQDLPATKQLRRDLDQIAAHYGHVPAIKMEARFPSGNRDSPGYPTAPFLLRVVSPRIGYLCGHVTAGGSICIEALTLSGSPSSWRPDFSLEAILATVLTNMVNVDVVHVQTPTGPGGQSGPLRVDMAKGRDVVRPYSLTEAESAFQRTLNNHGWSNKSRGGGGGGGGSGSSRVPLVVPKGIPSKIQNIYSPSFPTNKAQNVLQTQGVFALHQHHQQQQVQPPINHPLQIQQPRRPSSPTRHRGAASQMADPFLDAQHLRKRDRKKTEVVDLTVITDDEDGTFDDDDEVMVLESDRPGRSKRIKKQPGTGSHRRDKTRAYSDAVEREDEDDEDDEDFMAVQPAVQPAVPRVPTLEERLSAANLATGLHLLPPPSHWEITDEVLLGKRVFIELPLPQGHASYTAGHGTAAAAAAAQWGGHNQDDVLLLQQNGLSQAEAVKALDDTSGDVQQAIDLLISRGGFGGGGGVNGGKNYSEESIQEMMVLNNVSREDAESALEISGGSVDAALIVCLECRETGITPKMALRQHRRQNSNQGGINDATSQQQRQNEAENARKIREEQQKRDELEKEAERVLQRFSEHNGLVADRIVRIERVQNLTLWTEYERFKSRIALDTQGLVNERRLFHGAHRNVLTTICCKEGFDIRVSNLGGALGAGVYFADSSTYSDAYARAPPRSAIPGAAPNLMRGMPVWPPGAPAQYMPSLHSTTQHHQQNSRGHTHTQTPGFVDNHVAMLLCDVALGSSTPGAPQMRRPPEGFHSTKTTGIWAVFDNRQAYPTYLVHYN